MIEPRSYKMNAFGSMNVYDLKALFFSSATTQGIGLELTGKDGATSRVLVRMSKKEKAALAKALINEVL